MFSSICSLFVSWSRNLKVHRANCQAISSYPVKFSIDAVKNNNIFFLLFSFSFFFFFFLFSLFSFAFCLYVFVFLLEIKNIYSDTHRTMRASKLWKNFNPPDFRKQDYLFFGLTPDYLLWDSLSFPTTKKIRFHQQKCYILIQYR